MQLFQVEYCGMYPIIHLYFLENTNDLWDIPVHTTRKGCITILIGCIFYERVLKLSATRSLLLTSIFVLKNIC